VLDFSHKGPKDEITPEDMAPHADQVTPGSRLLFRTGWDKQFPQPHYFSDQPYLGTRVCQWLVERQVATVALDMPTIYPADYITVHHILLKPEVLVIEGLTGLERLRGPQVLLCALPLRIRGRDGSPCRAMAIDADSAGELEPLLELFAKLTYS
jgi:kynurenine formamidase